MAPPDRVDACKVVHMTPQMALRLAEQHKKVRSVSKVRSEKRKRQPIFFERDTNRYIYEDGTPLSKPDALAYGQIMQTRRMLTNPARGRGWGY